MEDLKQNLIKEIGESKFNNVSSYLCVLVEKNQQGIGVHQISSISPQDIGFAVLSIMSNDEDFAKTIGIAVDCFRSANPKN